MTGKSDGPIRVLIIDDSEMACDFLTALFSEGEDFLIVAVAHDGKEGVELAKSLSPDLITMDLHMPVLDGYEATEQIMAECAASILVITSYREAETAFRCVSLGALEVMDKPDLDALNDEDFVHRFLQQARLLASTRVIRRPMRKRRKGPATHPAPAPAPAPRRDDAADRLVAVAASTGGPQALTVILGHLPPDFDGAVLIVQHLAKGFEKGLLTWLASCSTLPIHIAREGERLRPGVVLMAPPDVHIQVAQDRTVQFVHAEPLAGHRPSAEYLFASAAMVFGKRCAGVILTGMGADGAKALGDILQAGGLTIAQDEASSTIYGMPRTAVELGTATEVLDLDAICPRLIRWVKM